MREGTVIEEIDALIFRLKRAKRAATAGDMDAAINNLEFAAMDMVVLYAQSADGARYSGFLETMHGVFAGLASRKPIKETNEH